MRTRDRSGVTSLQGPNTPVMSVDCCLTIAGRPFKYTKTGKLWNNLGGTEKFRAVLLLGIACNLVSW
jgi:hypothetical protein